LTYLAVWVYDKTYDRPCALCTKAKVRHNKRILRKDKTATFGQQLKQSMPGLRPSITFCKQAVSCRAIRAQLAFSTRWAKARFACFCPSGAVITAAGRGAKRAIAHQRLDATSFVKISLTAAAAS
jgi:hypothetical protein